MAEVSVHTVPAATARCQSEQLDLGLLRLLRAALSAKEAEEVACWAGKSESLDGHARRGFRPDWLQIAHCAGSYEFDCPTFGSCCQFWSDTRPRIS